MNDEDHAGWYVCTDMESISLILSFDGDLYELDKEQAAEFLACVMEGCLDIGACERYTPRIH